MILPEKKVNGRNFKTEFRFDKKHTQLVQDVLKRLKGKRINVPDPSKKWVPPWQSPKPEDEAVVIISRLQTFEVPKGYLREDMSPAKLGVKEISALEWLPVTCQSVAFEESYGRYLQLSNPLSYAFDMNMGMEHMRKHRGNAQKYINSINPFSSHSGRYYEKYSGGTIGLARELKKCKNAFRFVLAHELAHAIDRLVVVHPALTNWKGFCLNILGLDSCLIDFDDALASEMMVDCPHHGLDTLELFFGNIIRTWHRGYEKLVGVTN